MEAQNWQVLIHEMADGAGEDDFIASGFSSEEEAIDYARKRTRHSVEEEKSQEKSPEENQKQWFAFGEECKVMGGKGYSGQSEIVFFLTNQAAPEDLDYKSIEKRLGSKFQIKRFND